MPSAALSIGSVQTVRSRFGCLKPLGDIDFWLTHAGFKHEPTAVINTMSSQAHHSSYCAIFRRKKRNLLCVPEPRTFVALQPPSALVSTAEANYDVKTDIINHD